MRNRKVSSILAVAISLEMILTPVMANEQAATETRRVDNPVNAPRRNVNDGINNTAETIGMGLGLVGQVWDNAMRANSPQTPQNPQLAADMQKLREQMTPQPDKYFNPQKLSQIPGLANYLALNNINPATLDCKSLPTTLHDARPEVCRVGLSSTVNKPPQVQMAEMFSYFNQYFQVSKMYRNYTADSNADGQSFGVGCMNNAMNVLNGFFKYRTDELDKLTTNLEAMQNQFREASRADLDAIEDAVAVLDGGDSTIADKVRTRRPDLFDFKKRFNNPACNSMFAGDTLNEKGRQGGLNDINKEIRTSLTTKTGRYSGESYSTAHTTVVEDINKMADSVGRQLELDFPTFANNAQGYGDFLKGLPDAVSSSTGANQALRPDLFADIRTRFSQRMTRLTEQRGLLQNEIGSRGGGNAGQILQSLGRPNFEADVAALENRMKNECFQQSLASVNRERLMSRVYDPTGSQHSNRFASSFLKDKLNQILDDNSSSLEKKLADLRALETQTGATHYLRMENSYEVQDVDQQGNVQTTVVGASSVRTPAVFFSDLIRNCNAQFRANRLGNQITGAGAIQQMRQLNQDFQNLARTQASEIRRDVRKRLIECATPQEASNSVQGSCTSERFNTASPGFCANAALSCSQNMQACSRQAEGFVQEIKGQRTARVNNYKALMQKNKQDIVKIFDSALARYMRDGEQLRGVFGAGFSSPAGIQREVPEGQRYLNEFSQATDRSPDGKLLLEDPDQYVAMFKANIDRLKESVKKQQDQILGGDATGQGKGTPGLLGNHIKQTERNYAAVVAEATRISDECKGKHDAAVAQQEQELRRQQEEAQKRNRETGEKQQEFCQRFSMWANGHPNAACQGNINDLTSTVARLSGGSGSEIARFQEMCAGTQNTSTSGQEDRVIEICAPFRTPSPAGGNNNAEITRLESVTEADRTEEQRRTLARLIRERDEGAAGSDTGNQTLRGNCEIYNRCNSQQTTTTQNVPGQTTPVESRQGCREAYLSSIVRNIVRASGRPVETPTADSAPAFCRAGNNTDRNTPEGTILDQVRRRLEAGATAR